MSYIPPHKRHTKGSPSPKPTPAPESLIPSFRKNLNFREQKGKEKYLGGILYARDAVRKWFPVGLTHHSQLTSLVKLEPVSVERKSGETPLSLVLLQGCSEGTNELMDEPWLFVAKSVMEDLLLSFQHVKCEMEESNMEELKPTLVARFGRILFYGNSANSQESLKSNPLGETTLRQMKKSFYTNVPLSYMEYIRNVAVEKLDLNYVEEKELYYVELSDNLRSDSTVSCKCVVAKDQKKIQVYKIEVNHVRNMVADMSCLGKSLDLRLMLQTKKIMTALSDEEINGLRNLIGSAVLDSEVKGGLRWPFGEDSSGNRYAVISVWHTTAKSYGNSSIRFKLRHADRFDFRSSIGEVSQEASLKMPGIVSELRRKCRSKRLMRTWCLKCLKKT
ncbi:uncharacterized protein LOC132614604 isoform X2 [Lycium barbarum]|uniref:uncharacterized protein LOC132614604 isoform X2 n=1 Tax=Lycium barbarum TaxID=112863 RepID=UPI00293EEAC9|nr:uncharacterized protein LOC132614604 isoform X2 [Lycium barbarum]